MKIIRKVSKREMKKRFPNLMNALDDSSNADYCGECDGLRLHETISGKSWRCTVCGTVRIKAKALYNLN